jgi:four helix bundle protein
VADLVRDSELLAEAVRYQRFLAPSPGCAPRTETFAHDFAAWRSLDPSPEGPAVPRRQTRLCWSPSPALSASRDVRNFALAYLAAVHARVPTGVVSRPD